MLKCGRKEKIMNKKKMKLAIVAAMVIVPFAVMGLLEAVGLLSAAEKAVRDAVCCFGIDWTSVFWFGLSAEALLAVLAALKEVANRQSSEDLWTMAALGSFLAAAAAATGYTAVVAAYQNLFWAKALLLLSVIAVGWMFVMWFEITMMNEFFPKYAVIDRRAQSMLGTPMHR